MPGAVDTGGYNSCERAFRELKMLRLELTYTTADQADAVEVASQTSQMGSKPERWNLREDCQRELGPAHLSSAIEACDPN